VQVQRLVDKINAVHPSLVRYFPRRMDFSERTALFSVADVLVNSAVGNFTQ